MSNQNKRTFPLKALFILTLIIGGGAYFYYSGGSENVSSSQNPSRKMRVVAVSQLIDFPVLNQVRQGVKDGLKEHGYEIDKNIEWIYENAQGNIATTSQIAKKFAGMKPDVIVAITTPPAQAILSLKTQIPVVFAAVTDPIATKLVKNLENPQGNVTGSTDAPPVAENITLIRKILPTAKTLGVLYNAAEPNSTALLEVMEQEAKRHGFTLEYATVPKTSEAITATRQLLEKVDAILFPLDNTVTAVAKSITKLATTHKIPVFALDPAIVKEGALASIGVSEYQGGVEAGRIVARILNGEKPGSIPVKSPNSYETHLNPEKAKELGLQLPQDL